MRGESNKNKSEGMELKHIIPAHVAGTDKAMFSYERNMSELERPMQHTEEPNAFEKVQCCFEKENYHFSVWPQNFKESTIHPSAFVSTTRQQSAVGKDKYALQSAVGKDKCALQR